MSRVELALRIIGFRRLRSRVVKWRIRPLTLTAPQLIRCIDKISTFIPKSACLGRAIALQALLHQQGKLTALVVGVAKDDNGKVVAHAWLTYNGEAIYGIERGKSIVYSPIMTSEIGDKS